MKKILLILLLFCTSFTFAQSGAGQTLPAFNIWLKNVMFNLAGDSLIAPFSGTGNRFMNMRTGVDPLDGVNLQQLNDSLGSFTARDVIIDTLGVPTYYTVQDWINNTGSAGWISGGVITNAGSQTYSVSAGTGMIRSANLHIGNSFSFDWDAAIGEAIVDGDTEFVFVDYNSGNPILVFKASFANNLHTEFYIGNINREGTFLHILNNPDVITNYSAHNSERLRHGGFVHAEGLMLGETADRYITVTAGETYFKNNEFKLLAFNSFTTGDFDTYIGETRQATAATQWDSTNYNNGGSLDPLSNNRYGVHWYYQEPDGELLYIYGTSNSVSIAGAQAESIPTTLPLRTVAGGYLIGRGIFQKSAGDYVVIETVFATMFSSSTPSDHNSLSGLQGGTAGEYYHLTSANFSNNIVKTGTPVDNQIAVFTDANTVEGTSGLTYTGSAFGVTGTASFSDDTDITSSQAGGNVTSLVYNTSTDANSHARNFIRAENGDAKTTYKTGFGGNWTVGKDKTDGSYKWAFNSDGLLETDTRMTLDSVGYLTIGTSDSIYPLVVSGLQGGVNGDRYQVVLDGTDTDDGGMLIIANDDNNDESILELKNQSLGADSVILNILTGGLATFKQNIFAKYFTSTVAIGTAPYQATSTTENINLNANFLQGNLASAFALSTVDLDDVTTNNPSTTNDIEIGSASTKDGTSIINTAELQNSNVGKYYEFDGVGDGIFIPSIGGEIYGVVIRFFAYSGSLTNRTFIRIGGSGSIRYDEDDGEIRVQSGVITNPIIYVNGSVSSTLNLDEWNTVLITFDAFVQNETLRVGTDGGSAFSHINSSMVLVYNRTLTSTEAKEISQWDSNNPPIDFADVGASQIEQTSGTLNIGERYRINDWITNDDFTNVGGTNADGSEFIATGTTPTHWDHSSILIRIGVVLNLNESGIGHNTWQDASGNDLFATVSGATYTNIPMSDVEEARQDVITTDTQILTSSNIIPDGYVLKYVIGTETAGNTGTLDLGTSAGGSQVFSQQVFTASTVTPVVIDFFNLTGADLPLYINDDGAGTFNGASLNMIFVLQKIK